MRIYSLFVQIMTDYCCDNVVLFTLSVTKYCNIKLIEAEIT